MSGKKLSNIRIRVSLAVFFSACIFVSQAQDRGLLPDHASVQYAGGIGLGSFGIEYDVLGKHRLSMHYGYVPESNGGPLNVMAAKLIFNFASTRLSESVRLRPFDAGVMITYHFGHQFRSRWPHDRYPAGYYWWRTSLRPYLLTQTSVTLDLHREEGLRSITGYVELNTNELYLISFLKNHDSLKLTDIVKVGIGIRGTF